MSKSILLSAVAAIALAQTVQAETAGHNAAATTHDAAAATPAAVEAHASAAPHWSYPSAGMNEDWGMLSSDYGICAQGHEQSPIDLVDSVSADVDDAELHWNTNSILKVVDNGHTIQVNVENGGNMLLGDKEYELVQFHFHTPSEHAIEHNRTAMEVHFVHKSAEGELAVVGVMMNGGGTNALFNGIMTGANVPAADGFVLLGDYDLTDLLPESRHVFRYQGSLTTPPCTEIVTWTVLKDPISVSDTAIAAFQTRYPMNARALQPSYRRFVLAD